MHQNNFLPIYNYTTSGEVSNCGGKKELKTIAVIMAGGQSRRMGRDKAQLLFCGQPLLSYQIDRWKNIFDDLVISVDYQKRFSWVSCKMIEDKRKGLGPLAGLEAVMLEAPADRYFITAVDMPFGCTDLAIKMSENCSNADVGIIRRFNGRIEPMFALYSRRCLPYIIQSLDKNEYSFRRGLLRFAKVQEFAEQDMLSYNLDRILLNTNTVDDWIKISRFQPN